MSLTFERNYNNSKIKLWKDFYFDYIKCYKILKPLQKLYHKQKTSNYQKQIFQLNEDLDLEDERERESFLLPTNIKEYFENNDIFDYISEQVKLELNKVERFYIEIFYKRLKPRIGKVKQQLEHARLTNQFDTYKDSFDMIVKELFKEAVTVQKFVNHNFVGITKIVTKYEKYSETFKEYNLKSLDQFVKTELQSLKLNSALTDLEKFIDQIHEIFSYYFFPYYKNYCYKELNSYIETQELSANQGFWLGMFMGLLLFQLLIIVVIIFNYDLDIDHDKEFSSVFPMFRGFFVICLYMWLLGLTIWAWSHVGINYRLIFQSTGDTVSVLEIYKVAAMFSFILLTTLLLYILERAKINVFFGHSPAINLLPLIFWGSLIFYFICPFDIFNLEARRFVLDSLSESLVCFLSKPTFRDSFFVGNLSSFLGVMRDAEYSLCYYAYYNASLDDKHYYCRKSRGIYLAIAYFPHIIKILTSSRNIYLTGAYYSHLIGIFKHILSLITSTLSFMTSAHPFFFYIWLPMTIFSAFLSFSLDIYRDFKFLRKKGFPLRDKLCYSPTFIYYFIAIVDIILRFAWVVHLSPEIINGFIRPQTLSLILFSLEIFRRSMWNLIRVEVKHLEKSSQYRLTSEIDLPFIYENGQFKNNDKNLKELMKLKRQERIKREVEDLFTDKGSYNFKQSLFITDYETDNYSYPTGDLDVYLHQYQEDCKKLREKMMNSYEIIYKK